MTRRSIFLRSKSAAERARVSITRYLEGELLLEVNEEKTSICRPVNFTLLGHGFVPTYKKGERGKYRLRIAKKSWDRLKEKIKAITRKTLPITVGERIDELNSLMIGNNRNRSSPQAARIHAIFGLLLTSKTWE